MTQAAPRRRHPGRKLLIFLVVVVVLLVVADRVGAAVAERVAGDTLQSSQGLAQRPDVDIAGFPFLSQFAAGDYDKVTVTAKDIPVGNGAHQLDLSRLQVVLHTLTITRDFGHFHARTGTATGVISFASLSRVLGVDLSYAGNGRVKASKSFTIFGHTFTPSFTSRPRLADDALGFAGTALNDTNSAASQLISLVDKVFDVSIPFSGIPFNIRVRSLHVAAGGLVLALSGRNLDYSR